MKKILFILILQSLYSFNSFAYTGSQPIKVVTGTDTLTTDSLVLFLETLNVVSFYGKPCDSLLAAIPNTPIAIKVYSNTDNQQSAFMASEMLVSYNGGIYIRFYVTEFTNMNPYSATFSWNTTLFRKEKIYKVDIYKSPHECINGWCKE